MNPWQMAQQLKRELEIAVWPTGAGNVVFGDDGSVIVFAGIPREDQIPPGFPLCFIGMDGGPHDEDEPELIEQSYTLMTACEAAGDPDGEFAIIGASITDIGDSAGRGVGEVVERVRNAIQDLTGTDGAPIQVSASRTGSPSELGRGRHLVLDEMTVSCQCTSRLFYTPPEQLAHSAGTWTWAGQHCIDRFDFLQFRLVEKAGNDPSTDPSDGTVVATVTVATVDFANTVGKTYTIFADYNAREGTTVEGSSDPDVGSFL